MIDERPLPPALLSEPAVPAREAPAPALPEARPLAPPPALADELNFEAQRKITLRCGKSSITLYPNGKIVLRGEYILSEAEGVNRIAGGQIELN